MWHLGVLSLLVSSVLCQVRPPAFRKIGCPKPDLDIADLGCWAPQTTCLPSDRKGVPMGKLRNLYRIVRARSWWHCGLACDPTTPCKYWTYRHGSTGRRCYLLKSCCESKGSKYKAYQSGPVGCPNQ